MKQIIWIPSSLVLSCIDGEYIGCFSYGCLQSERDMSLQSGFTNTPDNCTSACQQDGYKYAGLYNRSQCMCSRTTPCFEKDRTDIFCGMPCKHDINKFCGGISYMSIYNGVFKESCVYTLSLMLIFIDCVKLQSEKRLLKRRRKNIPQFQIICTLLKIKG